MLHLFCVLNILISEIHVNVNVEVKFSLCYDEKMEILQLIGRSVISSLSGDVVLIKLVV